MTLLACNGNYLIADKRVSGKDGTDLILDPRITKERMVDFYRDDTEKIRVLVSDKVAYIGKPVAAVGFCGDVGLASNLNKVLVEGTDLKGILDIANTFKVFKSKGLTLLLLMQDGTTRRVRCWGESIRTESFDNGVIVSAGAGERMSVYTRAFVNQFTLPGTLLNTFLATASYDDGCSTIYDVYGRTERELVLNCRPTPEDVAAAYRATLAIMSPMDPKPHRYTTVDDRRFQYPQI